MLPYDRLKPDWLVPFMLNPAKYRPGIVMPSYWGTGNRLTRKPRRERRRSVASHLALPVLWTRSPDALRHWKSGNQPLRSRTGPAFIVVAAAWPVTGDFRRFSGRDSLCFQCGDGSPFGSWKGSSSAWGEAWASGNFNPRRSSQLAQDLPAREPKREALAGPAEDDQGEPGQSRSVLSGRTWDTSSVVIRLDDQEFRLFL